MSNISKYKNGWFLILFILIGIVLGGLIAEVTAGVPALSWLGYGQTFGVGASESPVILNPAKDNNSKYYWRYTGYYCL